MLPKHRGEAERKSLLRRLLRNFGPELNLHNLGVLFACAFSFVGHLGHFVSDDTGKSVGRG
jgi:hypothetical protein